MEEVSMIIAAIVVLFTLLFATICLFLYALGILQNVEIGAGSPPIGEAVVAYKFGKGPYKNCGDIFNEAYCLSPTAKAIGIYYDNPNKIPKEKLRYACGIILSEGGVKVEKELEEQVTSNGFKVIRLPAVTNCVKTTFPFINTMSIFIAIWKVYPKLGAYIAERKLCAYPMLEIYTPDIIHFMAPLAMQEDFYVPEALQCIPDEYQSEDEPSMDMTGGDESPGSSCSRSASTFSRSLLDTFEDSESPDRGDRSESPERSTSPEVQDELVSSSIQNVNDESMVGYRVHASKAQTNLLAGEAPSDVSVTAIASADDSVLHDSGICSGRTSADVTDTPVKGKNNSAENDPNRTDGNDSSSSFEEITMDSSSIPT